MISSCSHVSNKSAWDLALLFIMQRHKVSIALAKVNKNFEISNKSIMIMFSNNHFAVTNNKGITENDCLIGDSIDKIGIVADEKNDNDDNKDEADDDDTMSDSNRDDNDNKEEIYEKISSSFETTITSQHTDNFIFTFGFAFLFAIRLFQLSILTVFRKS